jgi:hypothetical protein
MDDKIRPQISASLKYLERLPRYIKEKPYKIMLDVSEFGYPQSNHEWEEVNVLVTDAQATREAFKIEQNGFQFLRLPTELTKADFDDKARIAEVYNAEVIAGALSLFPNLEDVEVVIINHNVRPSFILASLPCSVLTNLQRRRSQRSPGETSRTEELLKPVPYVHAGKKCFFDNSISTGKQVAYEGDFTPRGALVGVQGVIANNPTLRDRPFQMLTLVSVSSFFSFEICFGWCPDQAV